MTQALNTLAEETQQQKAVKRAMSATQKRYRPVTDQYNCLKN